MLEKKDKECVSVIIATYNAGKTLYRALQSIKNQDWNEVEIVIVDGSSKDNTLSIANKFDYDRKIIISEKDEGIYDALNKGVKAAHGEWVYVLGADDELLPDGLSGLMKVANKYDIAYGDVILRRNDGQKAEYKSKPFTILTHTMLASHQGIIMRRQVILEQGGFDLSFPVSADYELLLRSYLNGYRFVQTHHKVAYFSCAGESSHISWQVPVEQYRIYKKNNANAFPLVVVLWNFAKRLMRQVYDPKPKIKD